MDNNEDYELEFRMKRKRRDEEHLSHKDVEKNRREKLNKYVTDIMSMITPSCQGDSDKVDKLTTLRLAIEHMRNLKGNSSNVSDSDIPSFLLSESEIHSLMLDSSSSDKFIVVLGCDARQRILHISKNVQEKLHLLPSCLLGTSFLDLLHPFDVAEVKSQLEMHKQSNHMLFNTKDTLDLYPGSRRSFFCRLKLGTTGVKRKKSMIKKDHHDKTCQTDDTHLYAFVHICGYFKPWKHEIRTDAKSSIDATEFAAEMGCFVGTGTIYTTPFTEDPNFQQIQRFDTMHGIDGKFISASPSTTYLTGQLPQNMVGKSSYGFYHENDIKDITTCHYQLLNNDKVQTMAYRFKCSKPNQYINVVTLAQVFKNPFTHKPEMLLCSSVTVQCGILTQVELKSTLKIKKTRTKKKKERSVVETIKTSEDISVNKLKERVNSLLSDCASPKQGKHLNPSVDGVTIGSAVVNYYRESNESKHTRLGELGPFSSADSSPSSLSIAGCDPVSPLINEVFETQELVQENLQDECNINVEHDNDVLLPYPQVTSPVQEERNDLQGLQDTHLQEYEQLMKNQKTVQQELQKLLAEAYENTFKEDHDMHPPGSCFQLPDITDFKQPQLQIDLPRQAENSLGVPGFVDDGKAIPNNCFSSQVKFSTPIIGVTSLLHKNGVSSHSLETSSISIPKEELQALRDGIISVSNLDSMGTLDIKTSAIPTLFGTYTHRETLEGALLLHELESGSPCDTSNLSCLDIALEENNESENEILRTENSILNQITTSDNDSIQSFLCESTEFEKLEKFLQQEPTESTNEMVASDILHSLETSGDESQEMLLDEIPASDKEVMLPNEQFDLPLGLEQYVRGLASKQCPNGFELTGKVSDSLDEPTKSLRSTEKNDSIQSILNFLVN